MAGASVQPGGANDASTTSSTSVRRPAVAGTFYPADAGQCRRAAATLLSEHASDARAIERSQEFRQWIGAIVPHAGWVCSGSIAAQSIATLAKSFPNPDVVVVFGAVHTPVEIGFAALDAHDAWAVPGGDTSVSLEMTRGLASGGSGLFAIEERLHRKEHAIEVELPLIQQAWPNATLLPVEVPAIGRAVEVGRETAKRIASSGLRGVYLASSDLTHYGPAYGFTPAGVGEAGLAWEKDNDRRLLERVSELAAEQVVPEALRNLNACGAGAIAAMLAACRDLHGATTASVLRHANSYETLAGVVPQQRPVDAVGYASVVVGK